MIKIKVTGQQAVSKKLASLQKIHPEAFGKALNSVGEDIMAESKKIVPFEFNRLSESGEVVQVRGPGGVISKIILRYGWGDGVEYAAALHEGFMTVKKRRLVPIRPSGGGKPIFRWLKPGRYELKPKHGRQTKYLEKPFMDAIGGMAVKVAQRMKSFLGGA